MIETNSSRNIMLLLPTPPQDEGLYYPTTLPLDQDNDLVRMCNGPIAKGVITHINGRVLDPSGHPVAEAPRRARAIDYSLRAGSPRGGDASRTL